MTAQKGSKLLLKVGNGATPTEGFTTIGGLRITKLTLTNNSENATNVSSGAWRQLMNGAGIRSISISGKGIFSDAASEETLRGYAFVNSANNYKMNFGNGDVLAGAFQIASYERAGDIEGEEEFSIKLESAGTVTFIPA